MARSILSPVVHLALRGAPPFLRFGIFVSLILSASACDPKEDPYKVPEKKRRDLHAIDNTMSKEDLVEARKEAGIKSPEEIAAENAAWYETECRKYVKERLPKYRQLIADMRAFLDTIEKQAPKWKDDKAFAKFSEKHKEAVTEYWNLYDEVTGKGGEGGNTQIPLAAAADAFEQLNLDIGPGVIDNEAFPVAIQAIRDNLDKVVTALDDIEKDESLDVAESETGGEGTKEEGKEAAKDEAKEPSK
jgi:hypothetical protein